MNLQRISVLLVVGLLPAAAPGTAQEQNQPLDRRARLRTLNDKFHAWTPPKTRQEWDRKREQIRQRILISNGLWPLPSKTPLKPRFGPNVASDGYTVQLVAFASRPGHYVTGTLYRPAKSAGKCPGVLCPHGHWANGRYYDAGEKTAKQQLAAGAESIPAAARYPLQARFVQLARMGCVVFHYDMVGYADSTSIAHRTGFNDTDASLWLINKMGLQTWNSIRALDFIESLPEVDPARIGVTGASGGGTQTFILGAVDPRPAVAFPAVMASTGMQGGCVCENASYLRVGVNNIAFAALFAPKPLALSGADDWTIDIERLGLPELRQVYSLYDRAAMVTAKAWPRFKHNYNSHARQMMYHWFNEHLGLGHSHPIVERDFKPLSRDELGVWSSIKRPDDSRDAAQLRAALKIEAGQQLRKLIPKSPADMQPYRDVVGAAAGVMLLGSGISTNMSPGESKKLESDGIRGSTGTATLDFPDGPGSVRLIEFHQKAAKRGDVVLWLTEQQPEQLFEDQEFRSFLSDTDTSVIGLTLFGGETAVARTKVASNYPGMTFCYNQPLLSERVRDVASVAGFLHRAGAKVTLVGLGDNGPVAFLAAAASDGAVSHTIADLNGFTFAGVTKSDDEMMLPGALRYGDLGGLGILALPSRTSLFGVTEPVRKALQPMREVAAMLECSLVLENKSLSTTDVIGLMQEAPGEEATDAD